MGLLEKINKSYVGRMFNDTSLSRFVEKYMTDKPVSVASRRFFNGRMALASLLTVATVNGISCSGMFGSNQKKN